MTIDMTKIRPGCILPCRDRVVESVRRDGGVDYPYYITFKGGSAGWFNELGRLNLKDESLFDITSIIEPPFDWDKVKPGDAFEHPDLGLVYYIGPDLEIHDCVWVMQESRVVPNVVDKQYLTRAPEHDKEI